VRVRVRAHVPGVPHQLEGGAGGACLVFTAHWLLFLFKHTRVLHHLCRRRATSVRGQRVVAQPCAWAGEPRCVLHPHTCCPHLVRPAPYLLIPCTPCQHAPMPWDTTVHAQPLRLSGGFFCCGDAPR